MGEQGSPMGFILFTCYMWIDVKNRRCPPLCSYIAKNVWREGGVYKTPGEGDVNIINAQVWKNEAWSSGNEACRMWENPAEMDTSWFLMSAVRSSGTASVIAMSRAWWKPLAFPTMATCPMTHVWLMHDHLSDPIRPKELRTGILRHTAGFSHVLAMNLGIRRFHRHEGFRSLFAIR